MQDGWLVADESRMVGYYNKSKMIIGSEPKPIWTGAMIHSLSTTHGGPLRMYKLVVQVYVGKRSGNKA